MPVWMPGLETRLYQSIARCAARLLGRLDPVLSVYTRRSVACGEVVFGRSDIDLHILISPFSAVDEEARFLRDFAVRYVSVKRLLPCLGDCDVSTHRELAHWYRSRPFTQFRDRGWLRLYGKEFDRPCVPLTDGEKRDSLLWWFFWAWERLPSFYRAGNVRTCCNLFLDMVNAYGLYVGAFDTPKRRDEVLRYWQAVNPPTRESLELRRSFHRGFRGNCRALKQWLYGESLKLCDTLYPHVVQALDGGGCVTELRVQAPFSFSQRTYLLVDPFRPTEVAQALTVMEKNAQVCITTERTLKLYLYHRNPWEYYTTQTNGCALPFSPPPPEALRRAVRSSLHREIPRRGGFSIGKKTDRSLTLGPQYAQCKLYIDHGIVATSAEDLFQQYQLHYGPWPYNKTASRDAYFLQNYPVVCRTIEEISQKVT